MFRATFLGHQGWLFSTESSSVLVDPLLVEEFGHDGRLGRVFPPRILNEALFPTIDGVFITHEHEDHFNVPSLNRLDRTIQVYLSGRSSSAARSILGEMGFNVTLVMPGSDVLIGDLRISPFSPNHIEVDNSDEWDVLPFVVADVCGHGSFFSSVDAAPTSSMRDKVRSLISRAGIWCHTNNSMDWSFTHGGANSNGQPRNGTLQLLTYVLDQHLRMKLEGSLPAATLFCGTGFAFDQEMAWLNRHSFPTDLEVVCSALGAAEHDHTFLAPLPGQQITMQDGKVSNIGMSSFLAPRGKAEWPNRDFLPAPTLLDCYEPATKVFELSEEQIADLAHHLSELARYLYGRTFFKHVYSVEAPEIRRNGTFCIVLLVGEDRASYVMEYQPHACGFEFVDVDDPSAAYAVGVECWASDLIQLFEGGLAPSAVAFGRMRTWNTSTPALAFDIRNVLWKFFHPLSRPESFLRMYRRILESELPLTGRIGAAQRTDANVSSS